MSIAILSIPLGLISIILFGYAINSMSDKPAKGQKKDDDTALIQIIASVVLFFVSLGIFDAKESTGGLYNPNAPSQRSTQAVEEQNTKPKSEAQKEVEEYNKAVMEQANQNSNSNSNSNSNQNSNQSSNESSNQNSNESKIDKESIDIEKQRQAFQKWKLQLDSRLMSIDTTWSALWNDSNDFDKINKAIENEKTLLLNIKIPEELSNVYRQQLIVITNRYVKWLDSKLKACNLKSSNANANDIVAELARGDGFKIRANVEVSTISRALGLTD